MLFLTLTQDISLTSFLYLFGGIQALFITIYLNFRRNKNRQVSACLSLILIGLFLTLYDYFIFQNSLQKNVSLFIFLSYMFQLAYAPLTYFLIKGVVFPIRKLKKVELLHFLPAVIHLLYGIATFHLYPLQQKVAYTEQILNQTNAYQFGFHPIFLVFNILISFQLVAYLISSYRVLKKYSTSSALKNLKSVKKVKWFFWSIVGINLILLFSTLNLNYIIYSIAGLEIGFILLVILSLYLFYIAYFILFNHEVFESPVTKYKMSSLSQAQKQSILDLLEMHINKQKPYHNPNLTIKELSQHIDIPSRQLSQVINEQYGYNFYDFINYHRIKEAQELLKNDKEKIYSVSGIGYEVGFNSKSSFYSAFKKFTGFTPAAYREDQNLNSN